MRFVIVTGMSGSGKSTVSRVLEDEGFFCVDNLPILLLSKFAEIAIDDEIGVNNVAVGIDIRSGESFKYLEEELAKVSQIGVKYEILFLDADNATLIKRYKETRREHPLARGGRIEEGINQEREIIAFLKEDADYVIDTSNLLTRELRSKIIKQFIKEEEARPFHVMFLSFGFKYGIPTDADLVFDVRFLPNPYYDLSLRNLTGNDIEIQEFVMKYSQSKEFLDKLEDMLTFLIPNYIDEGKVSLVVGIGCTGGKHRSVTIANKIYERMKKLPYNVQCSHKDIEK
ncbi:MAG TPA: RNase adapter RapZ [Candidatus Fimousia stercorigallinarum]|nr:RNase adapter RapZ [Candidatus Fimousia stercorigallinarum]